MTLAQSSFIASLPYYGGKSGKRGLGRWVASMLPTDATAYVEPCGGMLGVLLQRPPAHVECVNDIHKNVYAWWRAVRDYPDELARWLSLTPFSRAAYEDACLTLHQAADDPGSVGVVEHGAAMAVVLQQGIRKLPSPSGIGGWATRTKPDFRNKGRSWARMPERVEQLTRRLAAVELDCRDATDFIADYVNYPSVLIYFDPPYARGGQAYTNQVDTSRALDLFTGAKARIAISGYPSCPWQQLELEGWHCHTFDWYTVMAPPQHIAAQKSNCGNDHDKARVECLWTNYAPAAGQQSLF